MELLGMEGGYLFNSWQMLSSALLEQSLRRAGYLTQSLAHRLFPPQTPCVCLSDTLPPPPPSPPLAKRSGTRPSAKKKKNFYTSFRWKGLLLTIWENEKRGIGISLFFFSLCFGKQVVVRARDGARPTSALLPRSSKSSVVSEPALVLSEPQYRSRGRIISLSCVQEGLLLPAALHMSKRVWTWLQMGPPEIRHFWTRLNIFDIVNYM